MADIMTREASFIVNGEEVKLSGATVKNYLTRGNDSVSDQEIVMFINLCKYQKLNPFLNEAYIVKFKGSPAQIITSKEAYMKKAERNADYDGFRAGLIVLRNNEVCEIEGAFSLKGDQLLGAWAEVYKKNKKFPYVSKINFEEYNKGKSTWESNPKTMIRQVALVQALREAFPEDLGALYIEEEQLTPRETKEQSSIKEEIKKNANTKVIDIEEPQVQQEIIVDVQEGQISMVDEGCQF